MTASVRETWGLGELDCLLIKKPLPSIRNHNPFPSILFNNDAEALPPRILPGAKNDHGVVVEPAQ
jgi:hypothetical protein